MISDVDVTARPWTCHIRISATRTSTERYLTWKGGSRNEQLAKRADGHPLPQDARLSFTFPGFGRWIRLGAIPHGRINSSHETERMKLRRARSRRIRSHRWKLERRERERGRFVQGSPESPTIRTRSYEKTLFTSTEAVLDIAWASEKRYRGMKIADSLFW